MAGQRELSILSGLVDGLNKRAENIRSIRTAKEKLDQQKKSFDLNMKIDNLQLEKLQNDPTQSSSALKGKAELLKSKQQLEKAEFDLKYKSLDQVHETAMQEIKNQKLEADIVADNYRRIQEGEISQSEYSIKDGGVSIGGTKTTAASKNNQFDADFESSIKAAEANPESAEEIKFALKKKYGRLWKDSYEQIFDEVADNANKAMQKPDNVPQKVWDKATDTQKKDFLNKLNRR